MVNGLNALNNSPFPCPRLEKLPKLCSQFWLYLKGILLETHVLLECTIKSLDESVIGRHSMCRRSKFKFIRQQSIPDVSQGELSLGYLDCFSEARLLKEGVENVAAQFTLPRRRKLHERHASSGSVCHWNRLKHYRMSPCSSLGRSANVHESRFAKITHNSKPD